MPIYGVKCAYIWCEECLYISGVKSAISGVKSSISGVKSAVSGVKSAYIYLV